MCMPLILWLKAESIRYAINYQMCYNRLMVPFSFCKQSMSFGDNTEFLLAVGKYSSSIIWHGRSRQENGIATLSCELYNIMEFLFFSRVFSLTLGHNILGCITRGQFSLSGLVVACVFGVCMWERQRHFYKQKTQIRFSTTYVCMYVYEFVRAITHRLYRWIWPCWD